jgi:hypothetical protein
MVLRGKPDRSIIRWRVLLVEAALWLTVATVLIRVLPFRFLAKLWGSAASPEPGLAKSSQPERVRRIGRSVARAAQLLPGNLTCLPQAVAAKAMLACRGIPTSLYFGVRQGGTGKLEAHAWLMSGSSPVVGTEIRREFREVVRFGRQG